MSVKINVLNSWKEIAEYMRLGVRTVQRYERDFGLPVRRLNGDGRGSVKACPHELDFWFRQRTSRQSVGTEARSGEEALLRFKDNLARLRGLLEENQRLQIEGLVIKKQFEDCYRARLPRPCARSGYPTRDGRFAMGSASATAFFTRQTFS